MTEKQKRERLAFPVKRDEKQRHKLLHQHLDELVAEFILHGYLPSECTVMELMRWSNQQVENPTNIEEIGDE